MRSSYDVCPARDLAQINFPICMAYVRFSYQSYSMEFGGEGGPSQTPSGIVGEGEEIRNTCCTVPMFTKAVWH